MKKLLLLCSVAALMSCSGWHKNKTWMYRIKYMIIDELQEKVLTDEELQEVTDSTEVVEL